MRSAERERLRQRAQASCTALGTFARVFPIARPRASLLRGRHERISGNAKKASARWRESLALARRLRMPYEQQLAQEALRGELSWTS